MNATAHRALTIALTITLALLAFTTIRDSAGIRNANAATELGWRQTEILHERARTHACQRALGKPLRPVGQRVVQGGWAYKRWVLRSWRVDRRFYCAALAAARRTPDVWLRLADCETGGDRYGRPPYHPDWSYNGRSGFDGALQFAPSTWTANRPAGYPAFAWQASPAQQVVVAGRVLAEAGWGAWPACSRSVGLR